VSYAIENRDPFSGPPPRRLRGRLRRRVEQALSRFVAARVDRLAFGTGAAQELYHSVFGPRLRGRTALVPAVPAPCPCPAAPDRDRHQLLFLGAFHERKGLRTLLRAWPDVRAGCPAARLALVGKGPLEPLAADLSARDGAVSLLVDPPRREVHRALRRAAVVVLLSQPMPNWREQVGLPLVEALAHGCAVVTTSESGLAAWLSEHGHTVLAPSTPPDEIATAIVRALAGRREETSVLADLPAVDGRLAADAWMFDPAR
jgi:glycosyltransferase involved in cell wall biosynthesis